MRVLLIEDKEDDAYLIREMLMEKEEASILLVWAARARIEGFAESNMVLLDLLPAGQPGAGNTRTGSRLHIGCADYCAHGPG